MTVISTWCQYLSKVAHWSKRKLFKSSRTYAVKWSFLTILNTVRLDRLVWYSWTEHAVWFYLRIQTTAHREYLMSSTVNNLVKFWVCKLFCLKRDPTIQKGKIETLCTYCGKRENSFRWMLPASIDRVLNGLEYGLSMESNCQPQFGSFELKLL
jgi:hypothetical protein